MIAEPEAGRPPIVAATDAVDLTIDPCAGCRPLGALLALKGIEGAMTLVHGSQGCSTYMRLYLTRHFKEPFDVASSSLNEKEAVYGGARNLLKGVRNVLEKYDPSVLGVVTTCLSETIGDDVRATLAHFVKKKAEKGLEPPRARLLQVSTPSYAGSMTEGYQAGVLTIVSELACFSPVDAASSRTFSGPGDHITLVLPLISPAEVRSLKAVLREFDLPAIILPDVSETLDGGTGGPHPLLPKGGLPLFELARAPESRAVLVLGECGHQEAPLHEAPLQGDLCEAGSRLALSGGAQLSLMPLPMGLQGTDAFLLRLGELSGGMPPDLRAARARYVDALADCHRITYGRRVGIIGEAHIAVAAAALLTETGADVRIVASASKSPGLAHAVAAATSLPEGLPAVDACLGGSAYAEGRAAYASTRVLAPADHSSFARACEEAGVDIILGSSHAKAAADSLGVPLVRIGFPVYDRHGGHRLDHLLYDGSLRLLDSFCNALL